MSSNKAIELILAEWIASLKSRDRSAKSIRPNFEDLFERWKLQDASFDDLYDVYLPKAIKAHYPVSSVIKNTYLSLKTNVRGFKKSEKEFSDEWLKGIDDIATEAFFQYFPAPVIDVDDGPKVYGSMSAKEYNLQRRYIEQFPILDTTELEKQWKQEREMLDLDDLLKNVLGNQDEDNN